MAIELTVKSGVDEVLLAWRSEFIPDCRGFCLRRKIKRAAPGAKSPNTVSAPDAQGFVEEIVASWVGFADGPQVEAGTRAPTTKWPIQKYLWTDYIPNPGDAVAYRASAMVGPENNLTESTTAVSAWSEVVNVGPERSKNLWCYFNRGIVASQWLARELPESEQEKNRALKKIIATPGDKIRDFLGGSIHTRLLELLAEAKDSKRDVYAALFELDDPELIPALVALKKKAHVVLSNGSVKKKGDDENAGARADISVCDVYDRMCAPRALGHNKFLVICDKDGKGEYIWTGSTNWSKTGLCTQANNAVLLRDANLAGEYIDQWKKLKKAGDLSPADLKSADEEARTSNSFKKTTLFFTPMNAQSDLERAGELIRKAKSGILFLMFNPGPRGSLLNDIIERASPQGSAYDPNLYVQGVVNQNPGTDANPVQLFSRGKANYANADVAIPAAVGEKLKYWQAELKKLARTFAMVHSKVIVLDPFTDAPVVMTGSHNMGPKASGVNDENFLIFEGYKDLAAAYASNIMAIYNQYRWRYRMQQYPDEPKFEGLANNEKWQIGGANNPDYDKMRLRELDFWFGVR